jgi:hypothetical protein
MNKGDNVRFAVPDRRGASHAASAAVSKVEHVAGAYKGIPVPIQAAQAQGHIVAMLGRLEWAEGEDDLEADDLNYLAWVVVHLMVFYRKSRPDRGDIQPVECPTSGAALICALRTSLVAAGAAVLDVTCSSLRGANMCDAADRLRQPVGSMLHAVMQLRPEAFASRVLPTYEMPLRLGKGALLV